MGTEMSVVSGIRYKAAWAITTALALLLLAALAGAAQGGPIDPPGAPGSTGKNVITSLPVTISQPGSYILNSNLTCTACISGQNGINVNANDVTLDLQGFELAGVLGSGNGIGSSDASLYGNLTVRNGVIRDWGIWAMEFYGDKGGNLVDGITAKDNNSGIYLGRTSKLMNCAVDGSTFGSGIYALYGSAVENCTATNNHGGGITLYSGTARDVTASNNGGQGITANYSNIETCTAVGNGTASPSAGIFVSQGTLRGCSALSNSGDEIWAYDGSTLDDCLADGGNTAGNGIRFGNDGTIRGCTARNNGGHEILAGNAVNIEDCVADGWTGSARSAGDGIQVGSKSIVKGCVVTNNAGMGISTAGNHNRIEDDEVMDNTGWGIYLYDVIAGNVVIGNRVQSNGGDCWDPGNNAFVKVTGANWASATHPGVNICG